MNRDTSDCENSKLNNIELVTMTVSGRQGAMGMLAGTPSLRRGCGLSNPGVPTVTSSLDFGVDDEVTSAAVGCVLDSLDDIHCLLEAKVRYQYGNFNLLFF